MYIYVYKYIDMWALYIHYAYIYVYILKFLCIFGFINFNNFFFQKRKKQTFLNRLST